jgi:predicted RNase H-like nuclease (RuvC/YqgF family)
LHLFIEESKVEYFVTKEQVKQILEHHGHHVVMDSAFITGAPMSEIEAIVDVCDVVAKAAYDQGVKDNTTSTNDYLTRLSNLTDQVDELTEFNNQLVVENKDLSERLEQLRLSNAHLQGYVEDLRQTNKDLSRAAIKPETNEAEELEKAIETIQVALSGSFRDNMRLEVSEQHAWLNYGDLKFLVEPMEAWQAVQSCVYLSGLEVDNET